MKAATFPLLRKAKENTWGLINGGRDKGSEFFLQYSKGRWIVMGSYWKGRFNELNTAVSVNCFLGKEKEESNLDLD